jgi:hypothetical protein
MPFVSLVRMLPVATLAFVTCAASLAAPDALAQAQGARQNRVVMQVSDNDPAKWNLALNNARNLQTDLGAANVDIEIVAYGPGIGMLKSESVVGNRITEALGPALRSAPARTRCAVRSSPKPTCSTASATFPPASWRSCKSSSRDGRTCGRERAVSRPPRAHAGAWSG